MVIFSVTTLSYNLDNWEKIRVSITIKAILLLGVQLCPSSPLPRGFAIEPTSTNITIVNLVNLWLNLNGTKLLSEGNHCMLLIKHNF